MEKVIIKQYNDIYVEEIVSLILNIQQKEFGIAITRADQPDLENISNFYQVGKGNFWVALHNGEVVGTISFLDIGNNCLALRKMFVKKEFRGKEYGSAQLLLENALQWAKKHSIRFVYLGTTSKFLAAHRFYEKNNFVKIAEKDLPKKFPVLQVDTVFYSYKV